MKELLQNKKLRNTVSSIAFAAIGVWAVYSIVGSEEFDLAEIKANLAEASLLFVGLIFIDSVIGYYIRAMRWKMLLDASGHDVDTPTLWWTMMYGYMINLGVPRLGEVSRCMSLQEKREVPFATSFSTILIERLTDVFLLFVIVITVSIWQYDIYADYIGESITGPIKTWVYGLPDRPMLLGGIVLGLGALLYFMFFDKKMEKEVNENKFLMDIELGLKSVAKLKKPWLYLVYTLLIWVSYYLTGFFCYKAIPGLNHLGAPAIFALLAFGSLARSLPVQGGGVGIYQKAVEKILYVGYGVGNSIGLAAGVILWAVQTAMQLIFGVISLPFIFSKKKESKNNEEGIEH